MFHEFQTNESMSSMGYLFSNGNLHVLIHISSHCIKQLLDRASENLIGVDSLNDTLVVPDTTKT